jgi:hypothetical protein
LEVHIQPAAAIEKPRSRIRTGYTATVFGATGFLGRYIVNRLGISELGKGNRKFANSCLIARNGVTCIIPFREEMAKRHLKVAGDLGRVIFMVRRDYESESEGI